VMYVVLKRCVKVQKANKKTTLISCMKIIKREFSGRKATEGDLKSP
jgi:hypothetical protein